MQNQVTYDAKSFIINGKREFLTSGSIHYFRVPRELWRDRLYKAVQAGLNTVQMYVAWNFHECEEGEFDFSGQRDIEEFLRLCDEFNLYVVMRPGPYICAEWDFGGLPTWLMNYSGIRLRTCDPVYLHFVDRWFEQLIPMIAKNQLTRGGRVILLQIENELANVSPPDSALYMNHLRNIVQRLGIDVPLITCSGKAEGTIECVNGFNPSEQLPDLRKRQPNAPLHSTEFWPGWYSVWQQKEMGTMPHWSRKPPVRYSAAEVERETWKMLAGGAAGYNYYMWHGGTNFGYSTMYLQTTSYDFDAPLSEVGGLTEKFHHCKRVAWYAQTLKDVLCDTSDEHAARYKLSIEGAHATVRAAENGGVIFLDNPTDRRADAKVVLGEEVLPTIPLEAAAIRPLTVDYTWEEGITLALATPVLFASKKYGRERVLVVWGKKNERTRIVLHLKAAPNLPDNSQAIVSAGLMTLDVKIPADKPLIETFGIGQKDFKIVYVNDEMLAQTFVTDRGIVVGAYLARAKGTTLMLEYRGDEGQVYRVAPGELAVKEKKSVEQWPLPKLKEWQWRAGGAEVDPDFDDSEWIEMGLPTNRVFLRDYEGYGWYRAAVYADNPESTTLYFKGIGDRAIVFVEGREVGVVEAPPEDRICDPAATFNVRLSRGLNGISVLTENLGHVKGPWQINRPMETDRKGIFDDVIIGWDPSRRVIGWRYRPMLGGEYDEWTDGGGTWGKTPKRANPRFNWYRTEFELSRSELDTLDLPMLLRMDGMGKGVIWLNGRNIGRYWQGGPQRDYYLPKPYLFAHNVLVIFEEGKSTPTNVALVRDPVHCVMQIRKM